MQSEKLKRYVLAAAVICIWGIIAYKVIGMVFKEDVIETATYHQPKIKTPDAVVKDYVLQLDYDDPFLSYYHKPKKEEISNENRVAQPPKRINWPPIKYKGSIEHNKQLKAIVEIGKSTHSVKRGESIDSIKIVSISADSITVKYQTENRTFKR